MPTLPLNLSNISVYVGCAITAILSWCLVYFNTGPNPQDRNRNRIAIRITTAFALALAYGAGCATLGSPIRPTVADILANPRDYKNYMLIHEDSLPWGVRAAYVVRLYDLRTTEDAELARRMASSLLLTAADEEAIKAMRAMARQEGIEATAPGGLPGAEEMRRIAQLIQEPRPAAGRP